MNQKNVKSVFLIGPNYAAGKDMLAGVASTFKGKVVGHKGRRSARGLASSPAASAWAGCSSITIAPPLEPRHKSNTKVVTAAPAPRAGSDKLAGQPRI